jgi:hypothetical protein
MEGTYVDKALLITCIDGLGRFKTENGVLVYRKDADTLGVLSTIKAFYSDSLSVDHLSSPC